ncbi:MAG TPA: XRE family transcriptional regulator [Bacteroidaceae bacterium]|nr:XRE family transcriptional regulator [Bacteroidaceae bacterium]
MDNSSIVGAKIKKLREERELSVAQLAELTGLAKEQIQRIEENIDIPSLAPLIKIARVLSVRLGTFLDGEEETGPTICRQNEEADTISFSNNALLSRKHMNYRSLAKSKSDRHMEPFIIDVEPIEDIKFTLSQHEGEELIYVLEGTMEICYGNQSYILEQGDSIYYDSIIPHHVHAAKGGAAKVLAVIYTPI